MRPLKYPWLWWKVVGLFSEFSYYLEVGETLEVPMALVEGDRVVLQGFLPWGWWGPWGSHGSGGRWWGFSLGFLTLRLGRSLKKSWLWWKVVGLFSEFSYYLEVGEAPEAVMALVKGDGVVLKGFLPWGWGGPWSTHGSGRRWWGCSLGFLTLRLVNPWRSHGSSGRWWGFSLGFLTLRLVSPWSIHGSSGRWSGCSPGFLTLRLVRPLR